jgi:pimeloyl-ACP methyl ester carboxylesterase
MMRTTSSRGAVALLIAAAGAAAIASAPAAAAEGQGGTGVALRRCAPRDARDRTRCGTVTVPLDRSGTVPGSVRLRVRVAPPKSGRADGTVIALAGGPGQAASPLAPMLAAMLGPVARTRRVVAFDQRGTGRSGRLSCPALSRARTLRENDAAVAGCARKLGPRRIAYTTSASVDDIEAVRVALGADRVALFAVSYGTKVATAYAARYPQHVSRMVLDSVVPPEGIDPFWRTTIGSARRVLRTICQARACRFTPDPADDLLAVGRRLQRGPLKGTWYDKRGRARRVEINGQRLFSLLLQGDFNPLTRSALPAALRAAARGDEAPLARLLAGRGGSAGLDAGQDSDALYVATTCEDGGVPWPAGTPVEQRAAAFARELAAIPPEQLAPFDGATMRRLGVAFCRNWPEAPIAQPPIAPLPDVPTLILSGDEDLRTPRKDAEQLAARLRQATLVTVPEAGHSVLGSDLGRCAATALRRFFAGRRVRDCSFRAPRFVEVDELLPLSLSELRPAPGTSGRTGRTLSAVSVTFGTIFEDLLRDMLNAIFTGDLSALDDDVMRAGGLRGGSIAFDGDRLLLRGYSVVPGVTLSGDLLEDGSVLRVGGRAAARGTLRIEDDGLRGRLGGRPVQLSGRQLMTALLSSSGEAPRPFVHPRDALRDVRAKAHELASGMPGGPLPQVPGLGPLRTAR